MEWRITQRRAARSARSSAISMNSSAAPSRGSGAASAPAPPGHGYAVPMSQWLVVQHELVAGDGVGQVGAATACAAAPGRAWTPLPQPADRVRLALPSATSAWLSISCRSAASAVCHADARLHGDRAAVPTNGSANAARTVRRGTRSPRRPAAAVTATRTRRRPAGHGAWPPPWRPGAARTASTSRRVVAHGSLTMRSRRVDQQHPGRAAGGPGGRIAARTGVRSAAGCRAGQRVQVRGVEQLAFQAARSVTSCKGEHPPATVGPGQVAHGHSTSASVPSARCATCSVPRPAGRWRPARRGRRRGAPGRGTEQLLRRRAGVVDPVVGADDQDDVRRVQDQGAEVRLVVAPDDLAVQRDVVDHAGACPARTRMDSCSRTSAVSCAATYSSPTRPPPTGGGSAAPDRSRPSGRRSPRRGRRCTASGRAAGRAAPSRSSCTISRCGARPRRRAVPPRGADQLRRGPRRPPRAGLEARRSSVPGPRVPQAGRDDGHARRDSSMSAAEATAIGCRRGPCRCAHRRTGQWVRPGTPRQQIGRYGTRRTGTTRVRSFGHRRVHRGQRAGQEEDHPAGVDGRPCSSRR